MAQLTQMTETELNDAMARWRQAAAMETADVAEAQAAIEADVRAGMSALVGQGVTVDEAVLVATVRASAAQRGALTVAHQWLDAVWARRHEDAGAQDTVETVGGRATLGAALLCAVCAAVSVKLPAAFGVRIDAGGELFYARNASLLVLPWLAVYLAYARGARPAFWPWLLAAAGVAAVAVNGYPFVSEGDTFVLAVLPLPLALWVAVGLVYLGGGWTQPRRPMRFVRFSGELVIYYALIALGGGVLTGFTVMTFAAIDVDVEWFAGRWLVPCGAAGAVVIGAWLVEARQRVVDNMAPVLTRVFTPLFTALLLVFLLTMWWTGHPINIKREVLIGFDVLLAVVVALVLYATSARDPRQPVDWFDRLQMLMIGSALAVDAVALVAIASRIAEFGATPNRVAALGENLLLLGNLVGTAWCWTRVLRGRGTATAVERWQVSYIPAFGIWAALVVLLFPVLFSFR